MKKLLELLVANLFVLIVLLLALTWGGSLIHQSQKFYERLVRTLPGKHVDFRAGLPNDSAEG
jgi:hypothetical protein